MNKKPCALTTKKCFFYQLKMVLLTRSSFLAAFATAAVLRLRGSLLVHDRRTGANRDAGSFFRHEARRVMYLRGAQGTAAAEAIALARDNGWRVLFVLPEGVDSPDPDATLSPIVGDTRYTLVRGTPRYL
jgi:hypothetical protein